MSNMPLKYKIHEPKKIYKSWHDVEDDYSDESSEFYSVMPEFLRDVYDGNNLNILESNNTNAEQLFVDRNNGKFTYVGIYYQDNVNCAVEFWIDKDGNLIEFVIDNPRESIDFEYYPSLASVGIKKPKGVVS